jgi:hypothetical protein
VYHGRQRDATEFHGFGAHLNTGSDLFHWVNDTDILYDNQRGITVRFVDDEEVAEQGRGAANNGRQDKQHEALVTSQSTEKSAPEEQNQVNEPDWLVLERKLRQKYANESKDRDSLEMKERAKLPLRGRWCSAY